MHPRWVSVRRRTGPPSVGGQAVRRTSFPHVFPQAEVLHARFELLLASIVVVLSHHHVDHIIERHDMVGVHEEEGASRFCKDVDEEVHYLRIVEIYLTSERKCCGSGFLIRAIGISDHEREYP